MHTANCFCVWWVKNNSIQNEAEGGRGVLEGLNGAGDRWLKRAAGMSISEEIASQPIFLEAYSYQHNRKGLFRFSVSPWQSRDSPFIPWQNTAAILCVLKTENNDWF